LVACYVWPARAFLLFTGHIPSAGRRVFSAHQSPWKPATYRQHESFFLFPEILMSHLFGQPRSSRGIGVIVTLTVLALTAGSASAQSVRVRALAGKSPAGEVDATGGEARFNAPISVAVDAAGNIFVADQQNTLVRKVTAAGVVTTFAGSQYGSADGTGAAAQFSSFSGTATDGAGNVYVSDTFNATIRKITPAGVVTTLAGSAGQFGSTDGVGSAARFSAPQALTVDNAGNVFVADTNNHIIRQVTPLGVVTTVAGLANNVGSTDGTGSAARFNFPRGIAVDGAGNLYVADSNDNVIRKIAPGAIVTTLAGTAGAPSFVDGTGAAARFSNPRGLAVSGTTLYVADTNNQRIRSVTTDTGVVTTFAGSIQGASDGPKGNARFNNPEGVAVDAAGTVYVADTTNDTIRKIAGGNVTTVAGLTFSLGSADGTEAAARFAYPFAVAVDSSRNVYVADRNNNTIRKITPLGVVTTFAGLADNPGSLDGTGSAARFSSPRSLAFDAGGNLYVTDGANNAIRMITPAGVVTTVAGLPGSSGSADGTGSVARFNQPAGVAVDKTTGVVYVADSGNHTIRKIAPGGVVTTIAGLAGTSGSTDGTGSAARFNRPGGVAVDAAGIVYIADSFNSLIRSMNAAGTVTTLAGGIGGIFNGTGDGVGTAARFNNPQGIAVDSAGTIYVADTNMHTIRQITPGNVVTTIAGCPQCFGGDPRRFNSPQGIAVDSRGFVYVADTRNNTIRTTAPLAAVWWWTSAPPTEFGCVVVRTGGSCTR